MKFIQELLKTTRKSTGSVRPYSSQHGHRPPLHQLLRLLEGSLLTEDCHPARRHLQLAGGPNQKEADLDALK